VHGCATGLDRLARLLRFGDLQLDILAGANLAGEITDRAADEARTEVEPEHDRCLRHGLEVDGAVAGAVRSLGRLADELGLEERLERERDRRLRDARAPGDLGSRDRRSGANRVQHRALVEVPEQGGGSAPAGRHLVNDLNSQTAFLLTLDVDSAT